ncbi:MAG: peptide deformylase, partial [Planctomycetes bacterium]|nr:peptide deformylase [Planctomycetota bacterium]
EEGCLSFPSMYAKVERFSKIEIHAQDVSGNDFSQSLNIEDSFLPIVVQHELDHLDGKVFLDHLSSLQLSSLKRRIKDMEKIYKKATGKAGSVLRR